jgi:hypothetical protein
MYAPRLGDDQQEKLLDEPKYLEKKKSKKQMSRRIG